MTIDILSNSVTRAIALAGLAVGLGCATADVAATQPARAAPARSPQAISRPPPGSTPLDLDGDGKPDAWTLRGVDGAPDVTAYDLDGDGAPDVSLSFADGRLVRSELLHDMGKLPATASGFAHGHLASKERAHDGSGDAVAPERWRDGAPESAPDGAASGGAKAPGDPPR